MTTGGENIARYLGPHEQVVWRGTSQRRLWTGQSASGGVFLMLFLGFSAALFIMFSVLSLQPGRPGSVGPQIFLIIPFVFLIIGLAVGLPLIIFGQQAANAQYFVTNESAIMFSESRWTGRRVTVLPLRNLAVVTLNENRDGTGSLVFAVSPYAGYGSTRYQGGIWAGALPAFWNIERPLEVYQMIRRQMGTPGAEE